MCASLGRVVEAPTLFFLRVRMSQTPRRKLGEVRVVVGAHELTSLSCLFAIVPQPDPNQPKPEGRQMTPVKGEPLGVICNWPPALESALQRWGSTQAKCPCLTGLDVMGKPVYTLTYGGSPSRVWWAGFLWELLNCLVSPLFH